VSRNRVVTPYTDADRFTPEEKATFDAGECCWDRGDAHWGETDTMCHKPSAPNAPMGFCHGHVTALLEDHWPDGSPRR